MAVTPQVSNVWVDNRGMSVVQLTTTLNAASVTGISSAVKAYTAGADGVFNTADDVAVPLTVSYSASAKTITAAPTAAAMTTWTLGQSYRLMLVASSLKSSDGTALDGEFKGANSLSGNGVAGGDFQIITKPTAYPLATFTTPNGRINVRLFDDLTPNTVANFLYYANHGLWDNVVIHRSIPGFIVQGGYETVNMTANSEVVVPQTPDGLPATLRPLTNEPGLSNVRGTIAMAKLGNDPNSATSQWFFNLANNSDNLDNQNGGFTAFGALNDAASFTAMDALAKYPTYGYTPSTVDPGSGSWQDWPMTSTKVTDSGHVISANTDLVRISRVSMQMDVAALPTLTTTTSAPSYREATAPVVLDSGIVVADTGNQITGAVIQISGGYVAGQDMLAVTPQNGLRWTVTKPGGVLTLTVTGTASASTYQSLLRTLTYSNSSQNPTITSRTITITLTDSLGSKVVATKRVGSVIRVNTAPTLTKIKPLAGVTPGQPKTITFADFKAGTNLADVDTPDIGSTLRFKIYTGIQGTLSILKKGQTTYTPITPSTPFSSVEFAYGDTLKWTPPARWADSTGLAAFYVEGYDGSLTSSPVAVFAQGPRVQTSTGAAVYNKATGAAVALDPGVGIFVSSDYPRISAITVQISGGYVKGEDILDFQGNPGYFNADTGAVTIYAQSTFTVAQAQYYARMVTYHNTAGLSATPGNRTITFTTAYTDSTLSSPVTAAATRTLVLDVPPVLTTIAALRGTVSSGVVTITYNQLKAASNLSDADSSASVLSFRIDSIVAGTLKKKSATGVITTVTAGSLLLPGESLLWTPPVGGKGTIAALKLKATDGWLTSVSPVTVNITI